MQTRALFIEQVSPVAEACTRCALLRRDMVIPAGERHLALLDGEDEMDEPPRVILCQECAEFVRTAMCDEPPPGE